MLNSNWRYIVIDVKVIGLLFPLGMPFVAACSLSKAEEVSSVPVHLVALALKQANGVG